MEPSDQKVLTARHPLANYQFTSDELRVLRECNSESFFQRALPLGTGLGLAAYFGVNRGLLKPNIKYGPVPKTVVGVIVGYFLGKFSYQQKCAEKIMQIPNSKLGEILRHRKSGFSAGSALPLSTYAPSGPDIYNDEYLRTDMTRTNDVDVENKPTILELDDFYRPLENATPELGTEIRSEPEIKPTYDELRKRNRESYTTKHRIAPLESADERPKRKYVENETNEVRPIYPTNKYGDTWTN